MIENLLIKKMDKLLIAFFFCFISTMLNAQTFSESYVDFFKEQWFVEPTQEMREQVDSTLNNFYLQTTGKDFWESQNDLRKQSTLNEIKELATTFKLHGLDVDSLNKFTLLRVTNTNLNSGVDWFISGCIFNDKKELFYKMSYSDAGKPIWNSDSVQYSSETFILYPIIYTNIQEGNYDVLTERAKKDVDEKRQNSVIEYQILVYNSSQKKFPLKIWYLKEFGN